jgi:pyruvate dehydrogenase E1 component alpha subunit
MQTYASPPAPVGALRDDGSVDDAHAGTLADELAIALYEQMVLARELDDRLVALQREGRIASHASAAGEEAAIVGAAAALRDEDWVFLASREIAAAHWRGMPLAACAHHLVGTARSAGKGRNVHAPPFWKPTRVASVSPLSGTQIPHAVGVAWAARMRKEDVAALVFFGDGATSSGDFHTGLNFAGVTRAPVLAVCRNNGWATSTPASRQTASPGFAVKAIAYGLRGVRVDGGDVVAVVSVVREARARASAGEGGTLIEAVTSPRRENEPDESWSLRDPIARMRRYLEARGLTSREREELLAAEVRADVERAVSEALEAALPGRESLFDDVYATAPWHLVEQREAALRAPPYASLRAGPREAALRAGPQEAALRADQEAALGADVEK